MKKNKKILALVLAAVLLVGASVMGTMAYLTSTDEVTNTFTVGKVGITLDEAKVDTDGQAITGEEAERVKENAYKLLPGKEYDKDPTVHVDSASEAAWLFVVVENGIADIEATEEGYIPIASQITGNGWTQLEDNVYFKKYDGGESLDFVVFKNFKINGAVLGGATPTSGAIEGAVYLGDYAGATVIVTAYAVQAEGFDTAADAWDATFGA